MEVLLKSVRQCHPGQSRSLTMRPMETKTCAAKRRNKEVEMESPERVPGPAQSRASEPDSEPSDELFTDNEQQYYEAQSGSEDSDSDLEDNQNLTCVWSAVQSRWELNQSYDPPPLKICSTMGPSKSVSVLVAEAIAMARLAKYSQQ